MSRFLRACAFGEVVPSECSAEPPESLVNRFLQVTPIAAAPEAAAAATGEAFEDLWSSGSEAPGSEGEGFDVRRYRYAGSVPVVVERRQRSKRRVVGEELEPWSGWQVEELPEALPEAKAGWG